MAVDEMRLDDPLDEQACAAVAALADGEPVEVNALRLALGDPAVREYLVDLVALRQAVRGLNEQSRLRWRDRRAVSRRIGWLSAAAVVVSLSAGYLAGQRSVQAAPAPAMESVVQLPGAPAPPEPTRVISLRPGVNWTEKAGAN
jgi:hypothetical protein